MRPYLLLLLLVLATTHAAHAQDPTPARTTKVGVQVRPLFPVSVAVRTSPTPTQANVLFGATALNGLVVGMTLRHDFNKRFSFETGLNLNTRNYNITMQRTDRNDPAISQKLKVSSYEIPANALLYIRLAEQLYINAAAGMSFDLFPSELKQSTENYENLILRSLRIMPAGIVNLGVEYRTPQSGYYYIGASYHRPVFNTFTATLQYKEGNNMLAATKNFPLYGDYLSIDLRYFFNK